MASTLPEDRVDQRLAARQARFGSIRVAPDDQAVLAVALVAPVRQRPVVGFVDMAKRQRVAPRGGSSAVPSRPRAGWTLNVLT